METIRKNSRKRRALLDALRSTKEHPTAETLYNELKGDYPELSLGTVYRNLSVLLEDGEVISVGNVAGHERYDARTEPHVHFICRRCHRVLDLDLPDTVRGMLPEIDARFGCQSETYSLSVSGLCGACR